MSYITSCNSETKIHFGNLYNIVYQSLFILPMLIIADSSSFFNPNKLLRPSTSSESVK